MTSDLVPELALIPAGEFLMGSDDAEEDERPVHRVHLDDFLLSVQVVTNAEYARFVRETGHRSPAIYELPIVVRAGGAEGTVDPALPTSGSRDQRPGPLSIPYLRRAARTRSRITWLARPRPVQAAD